MHMFRTSLVWPVRNEMPTIGILLAGVTHWQSPNFYAYYPANSSFPGILGEMLSAAFNVIGFSWRGCPAATDLETVRPPPEFC